MMKSLEDDKDFQQRIINKTFLEDNKIKTLDDFRSALFRAFDTQRGENASKWFNSDEVLFLFQTEACKEKIEGNLSEAEFDQLYGEIKKGEFELNRAVPMGQPISEKQTASAFVPKKIVVHGYTKAGKPIKAYHKGYAKWTSAEMKFIKVRKRRGLAPKEITIAYNRHFNQNTRSSSSIKTKVYRV